MEKNNNAVLDKDESDYTRPTKGGSNSRAIVSTLEMTKFAAMNHC